MTLARPLLRLAMTTAQRLRSACWFVRRPRTFGVHAIVLTPAGRIVLVRHTYVPGWRMPSGGRRESEPPAAAILRELREEIGLSDSRPPEAIGDFEHILNHRRDHVDVYLVRDAIYRPRRSLEIEETADFALDALPDDLGGSSRRQIDAYLRAASIRPASASAAASTE
ncbi:NUDIX domain-containing protein [Sphingomonas naphthae]|uniref:NUDIX domain-containing protein n=1 Tax=Sphingomonas naphthae TaxID=1813468 RepID=A0ABY7TN18_9SPHN|nr:NUDIX domain-containing protein [Sphingomonas naphthae]WCT73619.1 NUDIX domain-containing protein [Sphingomonas naphthae]